MYSGCFDCGGLFLKLTRHLTAVNFELQKAYCRFIVYIMYVFSHADILALINVILFYKTIQCFIKMVKIPKSATLLGNSF